MTAVKPLPSDSLISPCPNRLCASTCLATSISSAEFLRPRWYVYCVDASCQYKGPQAPTEDEAIEVHNALCVGRPVEPVTQPPESFSEPVADIDDCADLIIQAIAIEFEVDAHKLDSEVRRRLIQFFGHYSSQGGVMAWRYSYDKERLATLISTHRRLDLVDEGATEEPLYAARESLASHTAQEPAGPQEVTCYQGVRIKCTHHLRPIIECESKGPEQFDTYLVKAEVAASPSAAIATRGAVDRWPHIRERILLAMEHGDKHGWPIAKSELEGIAGSDYSVAPPDSAIGMLATTIRLLEHGNSCWRENSDLYNQWEQDKEQVVKEAIALIAQARSAR